MPSLVATGNFTSFMGDGNLGWVNQDYNLSYAGTWGLGLQLRDMSFLEASATPSAWPTGAAPTAPAWSST